MIDPSESLRIFVFFSARTADVHKAQQNRGNPRQNQAGRRRHKNPVQKRAARDHIYRRVGRRMKQKRIYKAAALFIDKSDQHSHQKTVQHLYDVAMIDAEQQGRQYHRCGNGGKTGLCSVIDHSAEDDFLRKGRYDAV